jgi:hypothetical protein
MDKVETEMPANASPLVERSIPALTCSPAWLQVAQRGYGSNEETTAAMREARQGQLTSF